MPSAHPLRPARFSFSSLSFISSVARTQEASSFTLIRHMLWKSIFLLNGLHYSASNDRGRHGEKWALTKDVVHKTNICIESYISSAEKKTVSHKDKDLCLSLMWHISNTQQEKGAQPLLICPTIYPSSSFYPVQACKGQEPISCQRAITERQSLV